MGLFNKRPSGRKIYTLQQAMSFVSKNEGYSVIEENGGYRVISDKTARVEIERHKSQLSRRGELRKSMRVGSTPSAVGPRENSNYGHRYGYYEEER